MTWSAEDLTAVRLLEQGLGPIHILKITEHEEIRMTDASDREDWGDEQQSAPAAAAGATYPEYPYSLADHVYTWSPKLPDGSMMVIRSQSADGLTEAAEALAAVAGRLRMAWQDVVGTPQGAPQAPAQGVGVPPMHAPRGNTPPPFGPNVSVPQAPNYQGPSAGQQAPQWGGQQQSYAPQGPQLPPGWYRLTVPFPKKPQFDGIVQQYGIVKGDPGRGGQVSFQKASKSWYCAPEVAQVFAQFQPVPA